MKPTKPLHLETLAIHAGRRIDLATKAVSQPLVLSTTFQRDPDGEYPLGFAYTRETNPNRKALEQCLAALEGGTEALAFSSGMAVVTAALQGMEPGDHVIAPATSITACAKSLRASLENGKSTSPTWTSPTSTPRARPCAPRRD